MRVVVNLTRCEAYAQCAFLAPDVFRMRGVEALMYDPQPDDAQRDKVSRAAAACPVQAILVDDLEDREVPASAGLSAVRLGQPAPDDGYTAR
ncbi:ferredoxin [Dactylosporangium sp. NPDC000244]|uniref:ferredoxin n=1 Tax=Dactylosporangium sp. NPDC000244 TaxID=3154365 RepID=UPI00332F2B36